MHVLFLDDEIDRVNKFKRQVGPDVQVTHVMNGQDFIAAIDDNQYDVIMLDHDLNDRDKNGVEWTGTNAMDYLIMNKRSLNIGQKIVIHSTNTIGVAKMMDMVKWVDGLRVNVIHFAWYTAQFKDGLLSFVI